MNYLDIKEYCKRGKIGKIPNWEGYLKWDYANDQLIFTNNDYIMQEEELISKIKDLDNLYYII